MPIMSSIHYFEDILSSTSLKGAIDSETNSISARKQNFQFTMVVGGSYE